MCNKRNTQAKPQGKPTLKHYSGTFTNCPPPGEFTHVTLYSVQWCVTAIQGRNYVL